MRSQAAMAACRMLYLSLRSWIGRQKRCEYMLKLASMPMVTDAGEHAEAAAPDDQRDGDGREQFNGRVVERIGEDRVFERDHVQAIDGFEVLVGALFAVEELDHAHAADVFLGEAVDAGDGGADAAIALADAVAEDARDDENERQDGEGQQRQPPVDAEHDDGHDRRG